MKVLSPEFRRILGSYLILVLAGTITAPVICCQTQQPAGKIDIDVINRIKNEELQHSQVMETVGYLTDVIGPRLTGSPGLRKAQQYAIERLREWGIPNGQLEPWGRPFGRGWSLEGFTANVTAPGFSSLIAYPKAWSPATNGMVRGEAVFFDVRTEADLAKYKGKLKGKIVLFASARPVEPSFLPPARRTSDEELRKLSEAKFESERPNFQLSSERRARAELNYRKWQMLIDESAAVVLEPGFGDAGTVFVTGATVPVPLDAPDERRPRPWDLNAPKILPQVVIAAEQYNRIIRLVSRGLAVHLEINVDARFYDQDPMAYNVIAEIPGSDLKDEVVMIGGCLDSWHTGTGATDNAAGAAVALEVMRLFKTLNLKPRRTVRIGLWSAEEQGAFGSQAYVASHFAKRTGAARFDFKPEYEKFSAYFNLDYGTGKIRGVYLQGNERVRPIFNAWLAPFKEMGAEMLTSAGIYSTDHNSFDEVGLPGFQFIRDFMQNNPRTAHTNMDVYEHVFQDDLKQSAVIAASFIYQAAMRDEKLPRKRNPNDQQ